MNVTYTKVKPLIEGAKEVVRILMLGVIPVILTGINTSTGEILINWAVVLATSIALVLTALLKGVDKERHLTGKIEKNSVKIKGLTQF